MNKKASLPLNTIIVAIIAILVLVVLVVVFMRGMGDYGSAARSCTATYNGICKDKCADGEAGYTKTDCQKSEPAQMCCVAIEK